MKINIQGLKSGSFELNEAVDFSKINLDNEHVDMKTPFQVQMNGELFNFNYQIKLSFAGKVEFPCDRCSETFSYKIDSSVEVIYSKTDLSDDEADEDILTLDSDATEIDVTDVLLESIVLAFPMKRLHTKKCKGVCECGANLNIDPCTCKQKIDPRWEALAELKNRN